MADPRQVLEAKRAKILADAQKEAAEIEQDIKKLEEFNSLAAKYGLALVEQTAPTASEVATAHTESAKATMNGNGGLIADAIVVKSAYRQAVEAAEKIVRAKNAPMRLHQIYEQIEPMGIKIGGIRPLSTLSAYLSTSERLESIRKGWWWLKSVPIPKDGGTTIQQTGSIVRRRI